MIPLDLERLTLAGPKLLEASAGCGKTYALKELYRRLIVEAGLRVEEILVVTYTRAATAELRERIRDDLLTSYQNASKDGATDKEHHRRLARAVQDFDLAQIFTMHGFCQRALQEQAFDSGVRLDAQLRGDLSTTLETVFDELWLTALEQVPASLVSYLHQSPAFALATLRRTAYRVVEDPTLPWLSSLGDCIGEDSNTDFANMERQAISDLARTEELFSVAHRHAAACWRRDRKNLIQTLLDHPSLHRGQYRPASILNNWVPALDLRFSQEQLARSVDPLPKLAAGTMVTRKGAEAPQHAFFDACDALLSAELQHREALHTCAILFRERLLAKARSHFAERRARTGELFYPDLIHALAGALGAKGATSSSAAEEQARLRRQLSRRYRAALVDEFQDTDPLQYQILEHIFSGKETPLILIGDPKQAIYGFRGADIFAYLGAARTRGEATYTLDTNWRSDPQLLEGIDALLGTPATPFLFSQIAYRSLTARPKATDRWPGAALRFLFLPRATGTGGDTDSPIPKAWPGLADWVARDLAGQLRRNPCFRDGTPIGPADYAILCRSNAQALAIQEKLQSYSIPAALHGQASVFDSDEAASLEKLLQASLNPRDSRLSRRVMATRLFGLHASELFREDTVDAQVRILRFRESFLTRGILPAVLELRGALIESGRLLNRQNGEQRITNLVHLGELLHQVEHAGTLKPFALTEWLMEARKNPAARAAAADDDSLLRLSADADAVTVTTIHKSKGLEYPCVVCPTLWDGTGGRRDAHDGVLFHDAEESFHLKLDLDSATFRAHADQAEAEEFAEATRLAYVALTRAKHHCTVMVGGFRGLGTSPLGYWLGTSRDTPANRISNDLSASLQSATTVYLQQKKLSTPSDDVILEQLERVRSTAPKAVDVVVWEDAPREPLKASAHVHGDSAVALKPPRQPVAPIPDAQRIVSFSSLTEGASSHGATVPPLPVAPQAEPSSREDPSTPNSQPTGGEEPALLFDNFPRGPQTGNLVHGVLETIPFASQSDEQQTALRELCKTRLIAASMEESLAEELASDVRAVLEKPLPGTLPLAELPSSQMTRELEFILPVGQPTGLSSHSLADALRRHDYPTKGSSYPERVAQLGFQEVRGFMRGFVDLLFEHDGTFWVADYKSNDLGQRLDDYGLPSMQQAMEEHHYHLQALMYVVAATRHLESRIPNWHYERHFGGALYLFLRGMGTKDPERGVFQRLPSVDLVREIDALFGRIYPPTSVPR